ncbi:hypothetical protein Pmar_PMAR000996, partial [Perkinsus marinus ATCC 50983]
LAALHDGDVGAIFRDYEVEYRKRKALDVSCQLYQTSRELIRKFLTGVKKRRAAEEIETEDPRGRDRMRALREPTIEVAEDLFEVSEAVPHPAVRVDAPPVEASPMNPYLIRAKSLLADLSLVEKLVQDVKSTTGRKPPTCTWCQLPIRNDTHPMRNQIGSVGSATKSAGIRYCPVQYPDLTAFDRDILPQLFAERTAKKEKCSRCSLKYDDVQNEHRFHPRAVGKNRALYRHCPVHDPPFEVWCESGDIVKKLLESDRARCRNNARTLKCSTQHEQSSSAEIDLDK